MRGAWIEGRALDPDGRPLPDLNVQASRNDGFGTRDRITEDELAAFEIPGSARWVHSAARTDSSGLFELLVLAQESPWKACAYDHDFIGAESAPVVLDSPGERAFVELSFTHGATIRGTLSRNGEGKRGLVRWVEISGTTRASTMAGKEGSYELRRVPPGSGHVRWVDIRSDVFRAEAELEVRALQEYEVNLEWEEEQGTICGHVTNESGSPLADIGVSANSKDPDDPRYFGATTEADGAYCIEVPTGWVYEVQARNAPVSKRRSNIKPGTNGIDFVLPETQALQLRIVDRNSAAAIPAPAGTPEFVQWRFTGSQAEFESAVNRKGFPYVTVDAYQQYEALLPKAVVDLRFDLRKMGYPILVVPNIDVVNAPSPLVIRLDRGADLRARLEGSKELELRESGAQLVFVLRESEIDSVRLTEPGEAAPRFNGIHIESGDLRLNHRLLQLGDDAASLRGLEPGRYTLRSFPTSIDFEPEWFDLQPGENELTVRVAGPPK